MKEFNCTNCFLEVEHAQQNENDFLNCWVLNFGNTRSFLSYSQKILNILVERKLCTINN